MAGPRRITLLTDFGWRDGYVAAMRGVIAAIQPDAFVEDVAHDISPGDIAAGAWTLARYWRLYPADTIHVVVVDPGVGGSRRGIGLEVEGRLFIGPDNGVFTLPLLDGSGFRAVELSNPELRRTPVSATFHGRDIFAPAAAHLARGVPLDAFGGPLDSPTRLELPRPRRAGDEIVGEVVLSDRFGNLVTNIPEAWIPSHAHVAVREHTVGPVLQTYADVASGDVLALIGSTGHLEISVRDGSAAERLEVGRGVAVRVVRTL